MKVNAGHDLNLRNTPLLAREVPEIVEASIGHALIADALYLGPPRDGAALRARLPRRGGRCADHEVARCPRGRPRAVRYPGRMSRDLLELGSSLAYLDELYQQYARQPADVDASWHELLGARGAEGAPGGNGRSTGAAATATPPPPPRARAGTRAGTLAGALGPTRGADGLAARQRVSQPRPLRREPRSARPARDRADRRARARDVGLHRGRPRPRRSSRPASTACRARRSRELVAHLRRVYAGSVGLEFMHISSPARAVVARRAHGDAARARRCPPTCARACSRCSSTPSSSSASATRSIPARSGSRSRAARA